MHQFFMAIVVAIFSFLLSLIALACLSRQKSDGCAEFLLAFLILAFLISVGCAAMYLGGQF